jgi:hypothetical protein
MINNVVSIIVSLSLISTSFSNIPNTFTNTDLLDNPNSDTIEITNTISSQQYSPTLDYYITFAIPKLESSKRQEIIRQDILRVQALAAEKEQLAQLEAEKQRQAEEARIMEEKRRAEELKKQQEAENLKRQALAQASAPNPNLPTSGDYITLIRERCYALGCNSDQLIRVMYCESGGRANAVNKSSGASGLFQQMPQYWASRAKNAGVAGASIFDPYAQIIVATHMFSRGQASHWSCK